MQSIQSGLSVNNKSFCIKHRRHCEAREAHVRVASTGCTNYSSRGKGLVTEGATVVPLIARGQGN
eukprot:1885026-Lingulodinium_polyedra.AAC.1